MAENAARVRWAGAGVSLPRRFQTPRGLRLALRRLLADHSYSRRAAELRNWAGRHDGAALAADGAERSRGTNVFVFGPTGKIESVTGLWARHPTLGS